MAKTVSILTARCGNIRPDLLQDYMNAGGFTALKKAINMAPSEIISEVKASRLLGRGGAAYPTGNKWEQLYGIAEFPKYIVCNADEGEPGTFKDKLLLEQDPMQVLEGMIIAGYVFNSQDGYLYIRGEYLASAKIVERAIENCKQAGYLGSNILGTNFNFDIHIMTGAGAYVCGENSALLNSIEGKPGRPRIKPPHLAEVGLFGKPTLVNNVESFAAIPYIVERGGAQYHSLGTDFSGGTKLICLSGNIKNRGTYEIPFGISLREIIDDIGGGVPAGRSLKMLHLGGQSGPCMSVDLLDTPYCYKALRDNGLAVGSGAVVVVDDSQCIVDYLKQVTEFFIHESCGKCTPCREGNQQVHHILCKLSEGSATMDDLAYLTQLSRTMADTSFCGLGQSATKALDTCIKYFYDEIEEHVNQTCRAGICRFKNGVN